MCSKFIIFVISLFYHFENLVNCTLIANFEKLFLIISDDDREDCQKTRYISQKSFHSPCSDAEISCGVSECSSVIYKSCNEHINLIIIKNI